MMKIVISDGLGFIKSKEEKEFIKKVQKKYGKKSKKLNSINLNYVQGIGIIDENMSHISSTLVYKYDKGILFKIISSTNNKNVVFFVSCNDIKNAYFADGEIITKSKSVIKRGVVGTIIAGPIGAIIGGMSGIGEVEEQNNYLIMQNEESKIIFKSKSNFIGLENHFKEVYKDKLMTMSEIKEKLEQEKLNNL